MQINSLKLSNYRNHHRALFEFKDNLNIIIGNNGSGKTNILESIIVLSNTRSFRTANDLDLILHKCDYGLVEAHTSEGKLRVVLNQKGKALFIDDQPVKKTSQFIGHLNAILFKPADIELYRDNPKERRRILDLEIGKTDSRYLNCLYHYNLLLKDKNRLLKEEKIDNTYLDLLDEQMVPLIAVIIDKRQEFFDHLNSKINSLYTSLSGKDTQLSLEYHPSYKIEEIATKMREGRDKDLYYHYVTTGPHHEDYRFNFLGYDINSIASQGQKRMVMIAFKLIIADYIYQKSQKRPIILLDDIFSELDFDNQSRLLKNLPTASQILITGTDINGLCIAQKYNLIKLEGK